MQGKQICSLIQYGSMLDGLSDIQKTYVGCIGHADLMSTPKMKIRRILCQKIANTYDPGLDAFVIGGKPVRISLQEVEHITGLPSIGKSLAPEQLQSHMDLWEAMKDPDDTKITLSGLLTKLKADQTANFVRPFVLYTIGVYLCPTTQPYIDNRYLGIVRSLHTIKSTNMAQLTLDHLMSCVRKYVGGAANLEGNLPLLQVMGTYTIYLPMMHYFYITDY